MMAIHIFLIVTFAFIMAFSIVSSYDLYLYMNTSRKKVLLTTELFIFLLVLFLYPVAKTFFDLEGEEP